jgi:hypothetical protein
MRHLSPDVLLDLAEGLQAEEREPHLGVCEICRQELADLKRTLATAVAADVPEPSTLFWDHLSARVKTAIERGEEPEPPPWTLWAWSWRLAAGVGTAVVVLAVGLTLQTRRDAEQSEGTRATITEAANQADTVLSLSDDPSLSLIVDLAGELEWDSTAEAGLSVRGDMVERAVRDLSDDERVELKRMLREAMGENGA